MFRGFCKGDHGFVVGRVWDSCGCLSCRGFFEGLFNTSMQFRFSYLIINTETLVPLLKFWKLNCKVQQCSVTVSLWLERPSSPLTCIFSRVLIKLSSLTALPVSLKIRYILSCSVEVRQSRLNFLQLGKTSLACLLALRVKEINTRRVHYGKANQRSFRFVFCQISFPPLPSPPPSPIFCPRIARQNEIWGRVHTKS